MNEKEIEHLLRSLGIGATYRGYRYLNYGIRLCLIDEDYLLSVSKLLYPQIAKYFHTTSCSVEGTWKYKPSAGDCSASYPYSPHFQ